MAENSKVAQVLLNYEINKQKISELRAANAAVKAEVDAIGTSALKAGGGTEFLNQQFGQLRERAASLRDESMNTRAGILGLDTSLKDAADGSISLADNLAKAREELQRTKDAADAAGPSLESLTGDGGASSGGGFSNALRLGGSKLRALPSIQLGGGLSTDAIANVARVLGSIPPVALPAVAAVGLFAGVLLIASNNAKAAKEAADGELASRRKAIELIATGSKEDIQARINELDAKRKANKAAADDANQFLTTLRSDTVRQNSLFAATQNEVASTLGIGAGELSSAKANADAANKSLNETNTELGLLEQANGQTAQSAEDLAAAELKLADARKQLTIISENASDIAQINDLEATGKDVQAVQDLADAKRRDIEVSRFAEQASRDLAKTLEVGSDAYKDAIAQADKFHDAQERDRNFIDRLSRSTYALVGARQQEAETIDAVKKFNDERTKDTDDYLAKITDIETKNAEKLVALAQKKADAEEAAYSKLVDKLASLNLSLSRAGEDAQLKQQRDDVDAQTKFQRQQAKDARDHANKLLDIQRKANEQADDLIAKRDFSGLFRLRRDTNNTIQQENTQYAQQAQDRIDAFTQERDDRFKQYAREAEDRNRKYQRDLADANAQYNKELTAARNNYIKALNLQQQANQAELSALQNKYTTEQQQLQQAIQNELQLIQNGNVARALLQQAANNTLLAQAQQLLQALGGGGTNAVNAGGLGIGGGVNSIVNNSRSMGNLNFNINGGNGASIANAVRQIVNQQLGYHFG